MLQNSASNETDNVICLVGGINLFKSSGYYMYNLLQRTETLHSAHRVCVLRTVLTTNSYIFLNGINRFVFVAETLRVSCEVRTECLYLFVRNSVFKGAMVKLNSRVQYLYISTHP
jgi:hypothetical protein